MTNENEPRDEERPDPLDAGSPDLEGTAEAEGAEQPVPPEDDPELLAASRGLDVDAVGSDSVGPSPSPPPRLLVEETDGDAVAIDESLVPDGAPDEASDPAPVDPVQEMELTSHRIGVELKHVEIEVRTLLQDRDPKRKRKLSGTARWQELEDDVLALRYTGRIDEPSLARVRQLIARRRYLFTRLGFLAGTRPTWNT